MKKFGKNFGYIPLMAIILFLAMGLSSCEIIKGGTVDVKNNTNSTITVTVYKSDEITALTPVDRYQNKLIEGNGVRTFYFEEDGTYRFTNGGTQKSATVNNGDHSIVNF